MQNLFRTLNSYILSIELSITIPQSSEEVGFSVASRHQAAVSGCVQFHNSSARVSTPCFLSAENN